MRQPGAPPPQRPSTMEVAASSCSPADWSSRSLAPLLKPGKSPARSHADRPGARQLVFDSECTDAPNGPRFKSPPSVVLDGVEVQLASARPAGSSGRSWTGNQCTFDLRLADGSGSAVHLGADDIPPFTTVNALVRSGSAAWLSVGFNGYTKEFPKGGNRIIALDLCVGRVCGGRRTRCRTAGYSCSTTTLSRRTGLRARTVRVRARCAVRNHRSKAAGDRKRLSEQELGAELARGRAVRRAWPEGGGGDRPTRRSGTLLGRHQHGVRRLSVPSESLKPFGCS